MKKKTNTILAGVLVAGGLLTQNALQAQPTPPAPPAPPAPAHALTMIMGSGSFLGIGVRDVNEDRMKELKLREERGVEITTVDDDSPASKAGLQKGDVVLEYQGQRVEGMEQFIRMVRETPAGRNVKLSIMRNGAQQTITATVGQRKGWNTANGRTFTLPALPNLPNLENTPRVYTYWSSNTLGVEAEQLEGGLAEFFGVKAGVLVRSVKKGTPAEKAGLKAGDVILKVGEEKVSSPRDVTNALRDRGDKMSMGVTIVRDKREMAVTVPFDEPAKKNSAPARARTVIQNEYRF